VLPFRLCVSYRLESTLVKRLWDISPPIAPDSPLFPGDQAYSQQWTARIGPGCPVNLSAITMSPHIGAHADAPLHYADDARRSAKSTSRPTSGPAAWSTPSARPG